MVRKNTLCHLRFLLLTSIHKPEWCFELDVFIYTSERPLSLFSFVCFSWTIFKSSNISIMQLSLQINSWFLSVPHWIAATSTAQYWGICWLTTYHSCTPPSFNEVRLLSCRDKRHCVSTLLKPNMSRLWGMKGETWLVAVSCLLLFCIIGQCMQCFMRESKVACNYITLRTFSLKFNEVNGCHASVNIQDKTPPPRCSLRWQCP